MSIDLSWLPDDGGTGHMPCNSDVINFWKAVKEITNFQSMMEIGFNAGHSSSIILSLFDDVRIDSYDIGQFDITHSNGKLVKEKFTDRFDLFIQDSMKISSSKLNGKYDLMFIDGSHDYNPVVSDINLFLNSDIQYVIMDDLQNKNVKRAYGELLNNSSFEVLHETRYTAILPYQMRNKNIKPKNVPIRLIGKVK